MSDRDANPDEMRLLRELSEGDVERLLSGLPPVERDDEVEEVAAFVRAMAAAVPETPRASVEAALVPRLAQAAPAGRDGARPRAKRRRRPLGTALRVGVAVALLPVFLAGIAVAGVKLPGPADDAFKSVGIDLPNQGDESATAGEGPSSEGEQAGDDGKAKADEASGGRSEAGRAHGNGVAGGPGSNRQARGPVKGRANPPGNAVRRGPNPTPGTPRGKPELPSRPTPPPSNAGGNGNDRALSRDDAGQGYRAG